MIQTSQEYQNLMLSNVRPKCEPKITVEGTDNLGNEIQLVWNAQNISSMNYKRGIDPLGRELPYMTLEWTELYYGKLNPQNYPEKYANITRYMRVTLEFEQSLTFSGNKWSNLLQYLWRALKTKTWEEIRNPKETIRLPYLFLSAKPTVDGNTIKWTAVDLLSLLDENVIKSFDDSKKNTIKIQNPILYMLVNARGTFRNAKYVFNALTSTINYMVALPLSFWDRWNGKLLPVGDVGYLNTQVIFDGSIKDTIKNYLAAFSYYLDFYQDKIIIMSAGNWNEHPDIMWELPGNVLYDYPKLTNYANVGAYNFKNYTPTKNVDKQFVIDANKGEPISLVSGYWWYKYNFGVYGTTQSPSGQLPEELTFAIRENQADVPVTPIENIGNDNVISENVVGEPFVEDNLVNPFDKNTPWMQDRFEVIKDYFNGKYSLDISTIGNPALETSDIIEVDTNLYNGNTQLTKDAIVVEISLEYSGALKENIKAHEVVI